MLLYNTALQHISLLLIPAWHEQHPCKTFGKEQLKQLHPLLTEQMCLDLTKPTSIICHEVLLIVRQSQPAMKLLKYHLHPYNGRHRVESFKSLYIPHK